VRRLLGQLRQLERRTTPAGADRVSHPPGGNDDVANGAMGAIWLASQKSTIPQGRLRRPAYTLTADGPDAIPDVLPISHPPEIRREQPLSAYEWDQIQQRRARRDTLT